MTEIWIKEPSEESVSAFFDGYTKNAYFIYYGGNEGFDMHWIRAQEEFRRRSDQVFRKLHEIHFKDLTFEDSLEISMELSWHIKTEEYMKKLLLLAGMTKMKQEVHSEADRTEFLRPVSGESIISYFMGLSWLVPDNIDKNKKLEHFYKIIRDDLCPEISNERILELDSFFFDNDKILEYRLMAWDILGIRQHARKVLKARKND